MPEDRLYRFGADQSSVQSFCPGSCPNRHGRPALRHGLRPQCRDRPVALSPGVNVGKPLELSDNCYLIRHGAHWLLWDTGYPDASPRGH